MIFPDFSRRSDADEWMDDPSADFETFRACLADLSKANQWTLAYGPTLGFLGDIARGGLCPKGRPLRLLDVGCGYGDLMRRADAWAAARGLDLALTGVDLSPWSARAAKEVTEAGRPIHYVTGDAFAQRGDYDVVTSSLFTHHLQRPDIIAFLQFMEERAAIGWFVNDLHRHPVPWAGFAVLARVMRWHPFVQHDGPVSIARAFTARDWRDMIDAAGIVPGCAKVAWRFPFRLCVQRLRGAS